MMSELNPTKNENEICIETASLIVKNDFDSNIKNSALQFLKQDLNNTEISIQTSVAISTEPSKAKPITNYDKYDFLLEKNPFLDKLKTEFDLELE